MAKSAPASPHTTATTLPNGTQVMADGTVMMKGDKKIEVEGDLQQVGRQQLQAYFAYYNYHRPHQSLRARLPDQPHTQPAYHYVTYR